jgi:hypothetical protein
MVNRQLSGVAAAVPRLGRRQIVRLGVALLETRCGDADADGRRS